MAAAEAGDQDSINELKYLTGTWLLNNALGRTLSARVHGQGPTSLPGASRSGNTAVCFGEEEVDMT